MGGALSRRGDLQKLFSFSVSNAVNTIYYAIATHFAVKMF